MSIKYFMQISFSVIETYSIVVEMLMNFLDNVL